MIPFDMTASNAVAVTPSDSTTIPTCWALYIGTAGNLKYTDSTGHTDTVPVNSGVFPVKVKQVFATGTSASGITALYP